MNLNSRMKCITSFAVSLAFALTCEAQQLYSLDKLQGAWWSNTNNPTADFAIHEDQVWLDSDAGYHPCEITQDNVLVFDLGQESGTVQHRIISLDNSTLVLENMITRETAVYIRTE